MILKPASKEQIRVLELLEKGNVVCNSVAGSGKTTCNLHIAKKFINSKILLLTYNSKLKIETRYKVNKLNINNMEVQNYHSFCVKNYNKSAYNDYEIINILNSNIYDNKFNYDLIILDEAQDITNIYYELICKICNSNKEEFKLCILGDEIQSIYQYINSDERYIKFYDKIYKFNNHKWFSCKLNISFRITKTMSLFINNCMFGKDHILSNKENINKPEYIICNTFAGNTNNILFKKIKELLNIYKPDDIFILAPSVKSLRSPIRCLENLIKIKLKNVPVYVPISDEEKIDEDILKNKLVISTFHQSKGLERKVVLVFHFDSSYFTYYNKNVNKYKCPNELYVATTRASERLILIHNYNFDYLNFLNNDIIDKYVNLQIFKNIKCIEKKIDINDSNYKPKDVAVTTLCCNMPIDIIIKCISLLKITKIQKIEEKIIIPSKTRQKFGYELVSDINGIAIPAYYEYLKTNKNILTKLINENDKRNINKIEDLLYLSNKWSSKKNGYLYKIKQINDYKWLNKNDLNQCIKRMDKLNLKNPKFEINLTYPIYDINLIGYIDCIDDNNIYEFKCVDELNKEYLIQLALYMYLYKKNNINNNKKYYLFNVLTNEKLSIEASIEDLDKIIYLLYNNKYKQKKNIDDNTFINNCYNISKKYFNHKIKNNIN